MVALIVAVLQLAFTDVRYYLNVAVRVKVKACCRLNYVVIEDAQRPKVHLVWVLIVRKGKVPVR
jgi:hypothetical protein